MAQSVVHGVMTLGVMMSVVFVIGQASVPIHEFILFFQAYQEARISFIRLHDIDDSKCENTGSDMVNRLPQKNDITIRNVSFCYDASAKDYALRDINIKIPHNKVTALVGESGCGKTTLIKMLLGFYRPNNGEILVGDIDLNDINPQMWRSVTGAVMQDSFIFSDTIANNISLGTDKTDGRKLYEASKLANIDVFISSLPLGFETKIGMEGIQMSQGQRQRILLARLIYKDPDFIFMDEATNALDATNESIIMKNLERFCKNRTVVIAAHRLSTIQRADQIIVMNKARVLEVGNHEELIEKRGEYYNLVKKQMEFDA